MGGARLTCNTVHDSALSIVQTLRFESVHLVLAAEISFLLTERSDWRPDGLKGGVHNESSLWEIDYDLFILLIETIGKIDDEVVVQHWRDGVDGGLKQVVQTSLG